MSADDPLWFKGDLHTHSQWSDGDDYPEMIARWYEEHAYHFICLPITTLYPTRLAGLTSTTAPADVSR